ncbi:MAG TPA: TonB-dependent receptor [Bryobacteraceae bacterium]|jgi:hypothetical protein|nr:TonB-dependent receptor [Bryobacteraceae bacterium]
MRAFFVTCCLCVGAVAAFAQADRGTITGTLTDPAGAVVAGASVEARNENTGLVYQGATTSTGNYTIVQLPVGVYEISATVPGFKKYVRQGVTVEVAATLRIDIPLEVGGSTESITVQADAPLLRTESGDISHSVTAKSMDDLPILGIGAGQAGSAGIRNPYAMVQLVPGTMWQANAQVRVNGAPNNTQSFRIEGQDASNTGTPGVPAQTQPSVDAIEEVAIQTSNYAAEYGQVGGGMFNVTMKSGTNQFHGTAYENFVNEAFNAGQPFTDRPAGTGNLLARNRRNDYGFTIGGPVAIPKVYNGHDKTFFFFNFEQYREAVAINNQLETVPTAAYRQGNFATAIPPGSAPIGTDPLGRPIFAGEIYDPTTTRTAPTGQIIRDPFMNNAIPQGMFDTVAVKIQNLFPQPIGPSANGVVNNYVPNIPTTRVTTIPSFKIDQSITSKGKLSFFWQETKTTAPLSFTFGQVDGLPDPLATNAGTFQKAFVYRANYDHTLSPTLLFHFGGGYRSNYFFVPTVNEEGQIPNYNAQQQLGLNGGLTHNFFPPMSGLCTGGGGFTPYACNGQGGMQNFGAAASGNSVTQSETGNTSLTWVKNNHTYKFGAELRLEGYPAYIQTNTSGTYTFAPDQTSLPYLNGTTLNGLTPGFGYASFLLGDVKTVSVSNPVAPRLGKHQLAFFAQDSWKVTRKLTVDYGLRYDFSSYLKEEHGRDPFFSPTTPNPAVGGILGAMVFDGNGPGHCNCSLAKNYPYAFGPRLGVAFQITPKTVLRGGFGIIYGSTESNNNISGGLAGSSNTVTAPSFGAAVTTLAVGIPASFNPLPWPNLNPGQFNTTPTPVASPQPWLDVNAGRPPRQYQWSVGIQRELAQNLVVEATYVGNRGIWWQSPGLNNINEVSRAKLTALGIDLNNPNDVAMLTHSLTSPDVIARGLNTLPYPGFPTSQSLAQALRPFPQFTTITSTWDPLGDTWYEALQVKATKRLSHGLSVLSTFSWQKTLTNGSEIGEPNPGTAGNAVVNDIANHGINKYISLYDQPFLFNISITYITPKISGNKILSYIARDWTYGAFLQYSSGFPIQVPFANNNLNSALFAAIPGVPVIGTGTFANRVPGQPLFNVDPNCHCYDPNTTFLLNPNAWVDPAPGQFGTSAAYYSDYRTQRRPGEDMNLGRTWRFKERATLNIRFELTNVFNRAYWGNPTSTNAKATQTITKSGPTAGNAASGFGFMNTLTPGFTGASVPRNGTLIARFTF